MKQFIIILLAVLFLWIVAVFTLPLIWTGILPLQIFEGINSLFAGLAFAGIIYTILLQRKELSLQREELRRTREELKRSADAQEKSEYILAKTAEVSALSQLLSYYQIAHSSSEPRSPSRVKYVDKMSEVKRKVDKIIEELGSVLDPISNR